MVKVCDFISLYKSTDEFNYRISLPLRRPESRGLGLVLFAVKDSIVHGIDLRSGKFLPIEKCDRYSNKKHKDIMDSAKKDLANERDGFYCFGRHTPTFVGWVWHPDPTLEGLYQFQKGKRKRGFSPISC